jgi:CubicO group peptidase (beta-lactamase class C family)
MKTVVFALCASAQLQASIFDWFSPLSDRARRAQTIMEGFDPIVEKAIQDYQIPGVAIGIIVDGHIVYSKGFGFRDL